MNKNLLCAAITVALLGCQSPREIVMTPPAAYLRLPEMPTVPGELSNNLDLVNYIFDLHDGYQLCRDRVHLMREWTKEHGGNDAGKND
ncbi:MAG: hypothetical protein CR975_02065 [Gammaproteobacteria bacterium]|nr:MAG: hypothetical protein CR975_02065 [Gammaproteobacteria bacterium]